MTLFCDRNIGKRIPEALGRLGLCVVWHDDIFPQDTPDDALLERVGREGWLFVTRDMRFLTVTSQRRALIDHQVACFVLHKAASLRRWDTVRIIALHWDHIVSASGEEPRPFLHRLYLRHGVQRIELAA